MYVVHDVWPHVHMSEYQVNTVGCCLYKICNVPNENLKLYVHIRRRCSTCITVHHPPSPQTFENLNQVCEIQIENPNRNQTPTIARPQVFVVA